jgi:polysaccharide biosynthesis/export protein
MEALLARRYIVAMRLARRLIYATSAALILACQAGVAADVVVPVPVAPPVAQPSILGPGDQVKVEVFGNPDLTTAISVDVDGSIRMPLVGAVPVAGQSPAGAARRIEAALKSGEYLVSPQVTVTVVQVVSQRVSVLGEVRSPGRYPIEVDSTVFDLVALAGGINEKGSDRVYILRPDATGAVQRLPVDLRGIATSHDASSSPTKTLRGGDSIIVPKGTYFITGQVASPGEYRIEGEMQLIEAIARAGGVTQMGSNSRVEVRRRGPNDQIVEIKVTKKLRIEPGDIIRVKERLF